ncbi:(deoxy)nucleoside triphosphate pyrophosphohydrolase [Paenibacillus hunanensis]|uniref:(deoxy)nucleoside triphosphate pyrophosphohydrolase n=1 Tax=Paenibacillus hunanensis TaxID=539262 RepID=UPI002025DD06|nr:(deoxy)nucleoside triphosphate pyrophosphohydrolase [Paenibacillus hunanensis]MCL9663589.1 (deoxy)nucleoside triphosphate pyrophosphohydrolase [Paenibacillus hunanensis]
MKKHIHVVGAVIIENEKILCAQRGATKTLAYKWEFPGGKIEQGETAQEALKREIIEEMQCEINIGEEIDTTIYEYDFGFIHLTTFYCELLEGTPKLTEHVDIKWLLPKDLKNLDWAPADIPTVEKLEKL